MNKRCAEATPQFETEETIDRPNTSKPPMWMRVGVCVVGWAMGTALSIGTGWKIMPTGSPDSHPSATTAATPTETATAQQAEPHRPFTLPDFRPVIITDPSTTTEHVTDVSQRSQEQLKKAIGTLATTMSVPESNVLEPVTMVMPSAPIDPKTGNPCFSGKEIREVVKNAPYLDNAVSYVILPPHACEGQPWSAYAYHYSKLIITTTSPHTIEAGVIMHEAAHTFGLDHTRRLSVRCPDSDSTPSSEWRNVKPEDYDIIEDITNGYGQFPKLQNGDIDPASGQETVTGYHYGIDSWCTEKNTCSHVLNFVERNRLDPEKFPIRDIDPATLPDDPISLTVSPEPHNISGVRIPLPADHPIHQIKGCESVTHIVIGIDHIYYSLIDSAPGFGTTIIAVNKDGSLIEIDAPKYDKLYYSPSTKNILEKERWNYLYNDSATGVSVAARLVDGKTELRVQPFDR